MRFFPLFVLFLFDCCLISAQKKDLKYDLSSTLGFSSGNAPAFWASSNKFGVISRNPQSINLQSKIYIDFDSAKSRKWDYSIGLDVLNRVDRDYNVILHQLYARIRYRFITLQGGRMEEQLGNQDKALSSGGLLWSKNAPPMPKIAVGILEYADIPLTKGFFQLKGAITHGWFEKDAYVKNVWLHHKYLYIQGGGNLPVKAHIGFHHFAQWGGTHPEIGKLPSSLKEFKTIFLAKQYDSAHIPFGTPLQPEYSNRIGNHLGSRHFGLDVVLNPLDISLYYQTIFEDASGLKWHNKADGLWGIALYFKRLRYVSSIVYEYIHTDDQSMSFAPDRKNFEPDNYFNHYIYSDGWKYKNYSIGTPLITPPVNNRVIAHHIGLKGNVSDYIYRLFVTVSQNKGTYFGPFPSTLKSVSTYFEVNKTFKYLSDIEISAAVATDFGKMYSNKSSFLLTLRKNGKLF